MSESDVKYGRYSSAVLWRRGRCVGAQAFNIRREIDEAALTALFCRA